MNGFYYTEKRKKVKAALIREVDHDKGYIVILEDNSRAGYKIEHVTKLGPKCEISDDFKNKIKHILSIWKI